MTGRNNVRAYLEVNVLEVNGLKHNGGHAFEVSFISDTRRSVFIDGFGSWKTVGYSTRFDSHSPNLANQNIRISVFHERMLTEPKNVGGCVIPADLASSGEVLGWFPLQYKGTPRGAVKVSIKAVNLAPPAASATVPLDSATRKRILSQRLRPK